MNTRKKVCLIIAIAALAVVIGGWILVRLMNPFFEIEASVVSVSSPVSLAEAREKLTIPLPDGASNIQYAGYSEFLAYEFMLKFEAPEAVCKSYAMDLLREEEGTTAESSTLTELRQITEPPKPVPPKPPLNVDWFDVHNIKEGFVGGEGDSHKPMIWIDSERNLFYYMCTD